MFENDEQLISHALNMWANYIETGDVLMSSESACNAGRKEEIQALTLEQQKFIVRLRELANYILFGEQ